VRSRSAEATPISSRQRLGTLDDRSECDWRFTEALGIAGLYPHPKRDVPGSEFSREPTIGPFDPLRSLLSSLYISCPDLGPVEMIAVNYFIPYYVNDVHSDIRGIKSGWYTMDERGKLCSGPFSSECLGIGSQSKNAPTPHWLH
jgi:hypothetical protein